jgi:hypothetical protein
MSHTAAPLNLDPKSTLILYASVRSPFARRVRLALRRLSEPMGCQVDERLIDVFHPPVELSSANPLGMIPTLVLPDGTVLSDSNNIMEWIQHKTGAIYPRGPLEWPVRQATVLIDGVIQAAVAYHQEVNMRAAPSELWTRDFYGTLEDTLLELSKIQSEWLLKPRSDQEETSLTQLGWDLAVALEYLSFRVPHCNWVGRYPQWNQVLVQARRHSIFLETSPQN